MVYAGVVFSFILAVVVLGMNEALYRFVSRLAWLRLAIVLLVGALLIEINDEMIAAERRYIAANSVAELTTTPSELSLPAAPRT